jgi:hypothetical protein
MAALFLIVFGVVMRLLPHMSNATPVAAIALFGGAYLSKRLSIALPLAILVISDAIIGFDSFASRLTVYSAFALIGLLGWTLRKRRSAMTVVGSSLSGSIIFYIATNFAFLYPTNMYAHNWHGIMQSYYAALPFFRGTIIGDLFYTCALFGGYELVVLLRERMQRRAAPSV